jgi:2-phospho-L-lactate guanylyltransferase
MQTQFVALVPVKSSEHGKSRLVGVPTSGRRALALAFALDTLEAVRATPGIVTTVVITADAEIAEHARRRGCLVAADTGDLNRSLRDAAAAYDGMVVAVCADLPALRPDDLVEALAQLRPGATWFVADHHGTGTTSYAGPSEGFAPRFGPDSAAAHAAAGADAVTGDLLTLRHDVDTADDLRDLAELGILGRHTTAALDAISLPCRS